MTRVALVGVGRWGKNLLRVLDARCDVVTCCNKSNETVDAWLEKHHPHIRSTLHYEEVLRDGSIEAVVIATPIETHVELAYQALRAGKHVFVEKPMATTVRDAKRLMEMAVKNGLVLFVGHVFLYDPVLDKIKELVQKDFIRYAQMVWTKFGTFEEDIFWNLISQEVSIALELFETAPDHVVILEEKGVVSNRDIIIARLGFEEGRECVLAVNRCAPTKNKTITMVTAAGEVLLWQDSCLYAVGEANTAKLVFEGKDEPLAREVDAFLSSVERGDSAKSDGVLGLKVVEVVSQIYALGAKDGSLNVH